MKETKKASNIKTAVISLVAAIFVWAAVTYINPPQLTTTISNLPVRFTGEDELKSRGLTVVDKASMPSLSVSVKGRKNDLLSLSGGIYVEVDVSTITEDGEYNLVGNVTLPSTALSIESVKFSSVPVKIDEITSKDIPIKVVQTGSISGKLVKTTPEEEYVTITGAVSEINAVSYGAATVDVSKAAEGTVMDAGYLLMNRDDTLVSKNETIFASKTRISIVCSLYDAVTLPVRAELSDSLLKEYVISSNSATVTPSVVEVGVKDDDKKYVIVKIDSVEDEIDGVLTEEEGMYIPEETRQVKIKADIEKRVTRVVTVNVSAQNLAAGLTANITPVTITASGAEAELTPDKIKAVADLSGLGAGVYTLPVIISGSNVSVNDSYEANVTIF